MNFILKNKKAFTLVELAIAIVIFGILSFIAMGSYSTFVKEAKTSEGILLASSIAKVETMYERENGAYKQISNASYSDIPEIDARYNKYFKLFSVNVPGSVTDAIFTVTTRSETNISTGEIEVIMHVFANKSNKMTVTYTDLTGEKTTVAVK